MQVLFLIFLNPTLTAIFLGYLFDNWDFNSRIMSLTNTYIVK